MFNNITKKNLRAQIELADLFTRLLIKLLTNFLKVLDFQTLPRCKLKRSLVFIFDTIQTQINTIICVLY